MYSTCTWCGGHPFLGTRTVRFPFKTGWCPSTHRGDDSSIVQHRQTDYNGRHAHQRVTSYWHRCCISNNSSSNVSRPPSPRDLLADGDIHPNPGPKYSILQINIRGIATESKAELMKQAEGHDLVLVQETKRDQKDIIPRIPGFEAVHLGRNRNGGGVAIYVSSTLRYRKHIQSSGETESIALIVTPEAAEEEGQDSFLVTNFYSPRPATSLTFGEFLDRNVTHLPTLIAGDWNNNLLFKTASTQQCLALAEEHGLVVTEPKGPTRAQAHTAPDVQFCRNGAISNWQTSRAMSSDHSFIMFEFEPLGEYRMPSKETSHPTKPQVILKNFRKANWPLYMRTFLNELRKLHAECIDEEATGDKRPGGPRKKRTLSKAIEDLIRIINAASLASIPRGRRRQWAPLWTDEMDKTGKRGRSARQ